MAKPDVPKSAISPRRAEDFPEWYQQVIRAGDMAESSDVRGCMVIKPWGYGIWENMQRTLDAMFKATGIRTPSPALHSAICRKKRSMSKVSPRNARSSPITDWS
jgi:prolyl-tRNA synthetase